MPVQEMFHDHTAESIRQRLEGGSEASYLRDWIYGGIDGAVTTFAIVCGVGVLVLYPRHPRAAELERYEAAHPS